MGSCENLTNKFKVVNFECSMQMCFFLVMIKVIFFHLWICYERRSHDGFFFSSNKVREGSDLVRIAGFLFLGSIPPSDFISFHPIVFRGFQMEVFFQKHHILCFHPPWINYYIWIGWKTEKYLWITHLFLSQENLYKSNQTLSKTVAVTRRFIHIERK